MTNSYYSLQGDWTGDGTNQVDSNGDIHHEFDDGDTDYRTKTLTNTAFTTREYRDISFVQSIDHDRIGYDQSGDSVDGQVAIRDSSGAAILYTNASIDGTAGYPESSFSVTVNTDSGNQAVYSDSSEGSGVSLRITDWSTGDAYVEVGGVQQWSGQLNSNITDVAEISVESTADAISDGVVELFHDVYGISLENPPVPVSNFTVSTVDSSSIDLSWSDVLAEDNYDVLRASSSGGSFGQVASKSADTTSHRDNNLEGDTEYFYKIRSENDVGSATTAEKSAKTKPEKPGSVSVEVIADDSIQVSWQSVSCDNYRVEVNKDGSGYSALSTVSSGTTTYSHSISTLVDEVEYRVRAENGSGYSSWENSGIVDTDPNNLSITDYSNSSITLSWDDIDQDDGYQVLRATSSGSVAEDYNVIATLTSDTTVYEDSNLNNGTKYYYRVRALYNGGENSVVSNQVFNTLSLTAPENVRIHGEGDDLNLVWSATNNNGVYEIYRSSSPGNSLSDYNKIDEVNYTETQYSDSEVQTKGWYYYRLRAKTSDTSSDLSNQASGLVDKDVVKVKKNGEWQTIDRLNQI